MRKLQKNEISFSFDLVQLRIRDKNKAKGRPFYTYDDPLYPQGNILNPSEEEFEKRLIRRIKLYTIPEQKKLDRFMAFNYDEDEDED